MFIEDYEIYGIIGTIKSVIKTLIICAAVCFCVKIISDNVHRLGGSE